MTDDEYLAKQRAKRERELVENLKAVTLRLKDTKREVAINLAARASLRSELCETVLRRLGLRGHVVEFESAYSGPHWRRMVVERAFFHYDDDDSEEMLLAGKVITSRGNLSKDEWHVAASGVKDCGPYTAALDAQAKQP
jgi:hypothetical protein